MGLLDEPTAGLTDAQRRVLGNPSIPMTADEIARRAHPFIGASAEDVDALLRGPFSDNGWVVKLGRFDDSAKLAAEGQKNKKTIEMADEQAQILERRLTRPDLGWRLRGGDLWMLSTDGLEAIKAPVGDSSPMTPGQMQATVESEWKRVVHDYKPGRDSLASSLLPDEFAAWFKGVSAECDRVWNVKLIAPVAGGASGYSDAYEVSLLDAENQKTALGAVVDPWYMALSILAFNDTDTGTTADNGSHIPVYTTYARKSVAGTDMPSASTPGGTASNTSAITFAACTAGGPVTILACGNCSAATVGTLRKWGDVASTVISTTQTPATFAIGAYTTTTT